MNRIEKLTAHLLFLILTYQKRDSRSVMFFDSVDDDVKIRIGIDFVNNTMFVLDTETEYDRIELSKFELDTIYNKETN